MANEFITRKGFISLDDSTVSGSLFVSGTIEATQTAVLEGLENANLDTDKFLVATSDGTVKYRTGTEVLADIGGGTSTNINGAPSEITYFDSNTEVTSSRRFYLVNTGSDPQYGSGGDAQAVIIQGQLQVINDPTRNVGGSSPMQILVGSGSTGDLNNPQFDSFIALEQESAVTVGLRANGDAPTAAQIKMRTDINDAYSIGRLTNPYNTANTLRIKPMTFMEGGMTITGSLTVSGSNTFRNIGPAYFTEGNVGIGTTSPSHKLQVATANVNSIAISTVNSLGNVNVKIGSNSSNGLISILNSAGSTDLIKLNGGGNSYINVGNVGIGTTSPSHKLDVTGTGRFTNNLIVSGTLEQVVNTSAPSDDLNNLTSIRFFRSHTGTQNTPVGSFGMGLSMAYTNDDTVQLITSRGSVTPLYMRKQVNGTYYSWKQIWDENAFDQGDIDNWDTGYLNWAGQSYGDLNLASSSNQFIKAHVGSTNFPDDEYFGSISPTFLSGITTLYSEGSGWQLMSDRTHSKTLAYRKVSNGSWSGWRYLWSTEHFTTSSVNNWNTAYSWGDHSGAYLPIGGGTLTGDLTVEGNISASGDLYLGNNGTIYFNPVAGSVAKIEGDNSLYLYSDNGVSFRESDATVTKIFAGLNSGTFNINYTTEYDPDVKLYVNGTSYLNGQVTASGDLVVEGNNLYLRSGIYETRFLANAGYLGLLQQGGGAQNLKARSITLTTDYNNTAPANGIYSQGDISSSGDLYLDTGDIVIGNTSAGARIDVREDSGFAFRAEDGIGHYFRVQAGGNVEMRGDLTVGGIVTAQEFHTEFVSASILYDSGSTKFGDTVDDDHDFTGTLTVEGDNTALIVKNTYDLGADTGIEIQGARNATIGGVTSYLNFTNNDNNSGGVHNLGRIYASMASEGNNDGTLTLQSFNGSSYVSGIRIDETGKVGIGTNFPSNKLTVQGSISASGDLYLNGIVETDEIRSRTYPNYNILNLEDDDVNNTNGVSLLSVSSMVFGLDANDNSTSDYFEWRSDASAANTGTSLMKLTDEGNLGIGPSVDTGLGRLAISQSAGTQVSGLSLHGDSGKSYIYMSGSTGNLAIQSGFTGGGDILINPNGVGKVGIGTTSPNVKLEIKGDSAENTQLRLQTAGGAAEIPTIVFRRNSAAYGDIQYRPGGGEDQGIHITDYRADASNIIFNTAGSNERMRITHNGFVGIGTTTPTSKLTVQTSGADGIEIAADTANTVQSGRLFFTTGTAGQGIAMLNTVGHLSFRTGATPISTSGTEVMRIQSGGNVGIGTTLPQTKLHVSGGDFRIAGEVLVRAQDDSENHARIFSDGTRGRLLLNNGSNWGLIMKGNTNSPQIGAYHSGSVQIVGFAHSAGDTVGHVLTTFKLDTQRVGIGVTSPTQKLDVDGNIRVGGSTAGYVGFGGTNVRVYGSDTSDILTFYTSGAEKMRLAANGFVGIGTSSPTYRLDVNGGSIIRGQLNVAYDNPIVRIADTSNTIRYAALQIGTNGGNWHLSSGDSNAGPGVANSDLWITRATDGSDNRFRFYRDKYALGVYSGSLENVHLSANGNSYLNGGNVGIGTSSPQVPLHIADSTSSSTDYKFYVGRDGGSTNEGFGVAVDDGGIFLKAAQDETGTNIHSFNFDILSSATGNHYYRWRINNTDTMHLDSTGLGVGTSAPGTKLQVGGAGYFSGEYVVSQSLSLDQNYSNVGLIIDEEDYIYTKDNTSLRKLIGKSSDIIYIGQTGTSLIDGINLAAGQTGYVAVSTTADGEMARFVDGKLGIGTTAPSDKLHVVGDVMFGNESVGKGTMTLRGDNPTADTEIYAIELERENYNPGVASAKISFFRGGQGTDAEIAFFTQPNNTVGLQEVLRLDDNGFIGIGTSSPAAKLDIRNDDGSSSESFDKLSIRGGNGGNNQVMKVEYLQDAGVLTVGYAGLSGDSVTLNGGTSNNGSSVVLKDGGASKISLHSNQNSYFNGGNVGIGTTTPSQKLEVRDGNLIVSSSTSEIALGPASGKSRIFTNSTKDIRFSTANTSDVLFLKNSNGYIGIGTTSPTEKLTVAGNILQTSNSNFIATRKILARDVNGLDLMDDSGANGISIKDGGNVTFTDYGSGNNTGTAAYTLCVDASGNIIEEAVGAGTISGDASSGLVAYWDGTTSITGSAGFTFDGTTLTIPNLVETSARRYKENIQPLTGSLDKVVQMQGVSFNKIGESTPELGYIAEEVLDIVPELVHLENGEVEGIHYPRVTALLGEAVKELNDKVKAQELFIKDLVARIEKLENK